MKTRLGRRTPVIGILMAALALGCPMLKSSACAGAEGKPGRRTPTIASGWFRIVSYPQHHLNDFCLFRDQRGTWHATIKLARPRTFCTSAVTGWGRDGRGQVKTRP